MASKGPMSSWAGKLAPRGLRDAADDQICAGIAVGRHSMDRHSIPRDAVAAAIAPVESRDRQRREAIVFSSRIEIGSLDRKESVSGLGAVHARGGTCLEASRSSTARHLRDRHEMSSFARDGSRRSAKSLLTCVWNSRGIEGCRWFYGVLA
ncbi:hypothetical protein RJ55_06088 [Drechmeria coniospora]|nr:hypothetical protein RJ55_06088 [Drechmeria coniospora]